MAELYTKRQGEYLAFIHLYIKLNRRAPAEADIQEYFRVSAPAVHQMVVGLENRGLIQRTPGQARSIRLLIPPESLPGSEGTRSQAGSGKMFAELYPQIATWITQQGTVELGYDPNTDSCARALDQGGMAWSGGMARETIDDWLNALDAGIAARIEELGM
jgi:SOS-response transcriptional repressor LexA